MSIDTVPATVMLESLEAIGKDPRLTVLSAEPLNVETPPALLSETLTPLSRMFMRNNHALPDCTPENWSLIIDGLVRRPLTINLADLRQMPTGSYVAVLECSGNGRRRFAAEGCPTEGLQWNNGAVANIEWIGVPVALLLEEAGVKRHALQAECWGEGPERLRAGSSCVSSAMMRCWRMPPTASCCRRSTAGRCDWWCPAGAGSTG